MMIFGKKRIIKKYAAQMPKELRRAFGTSGPYTEAQVRRVVSDLKLNERHIKFAFMLFCSEQALDELGIQKEELNVFQKYLVSKVPYLAVGGSDSWVFPNDGGGFSGDGGGFGGGD